MLVEQNSQTHRELQLANEENERQVKANKLHQQLIEKLRAEIEQLKAKNFEMVQMEFMQGNGGNAQAVHGEKLKEAYEKQLKLKLEELQEKDRVISNKQEEILALELELDIIKTQREKEQLLIE